MKNKKMISLAAVLSLLMLLLLAANLGYDRLVRNYAPREAPAAKEPEAAAEKAEEAPETEAAGVSTPENAGTPPAPQAESDAEIPKDPAPDFTMQDMDGNRIRLSDFIGRPAVVNFWATWCGPCRAELPAFNEAFQSYGDEISFLMVNLAGGAFGDSVDDVKEFVNRNGFEFPVYFDTESEAVNGYGIYSIPVSLFIDSEGCIVARQIGSMSESVLAGYIDMLLP